MLGDLPQSVKTISWVQVAWLAWNAFSDSQQKFTLSRARCNSIALFWNANRGEIRPLGRRQQIFFRKQPLGSRVFLEKINAMK